MTLTESNVQETFFKCLYEKGEDTANHKEVHAVRLNVGFDPVRLKKEEDNIADMLSQLPDAFKKADKENPGYGGGWSFLNACNNKFDEQWADMHDTMDQLVALGLATGKVEFLLPRETWSALPGGMPYFVVN